MASLSSHSVDEGSYRVGRTGPPLVRTALVLAILVIALLFACGCARQTPISELTSSNVAVWVRLTTSDGEQLTGRLVSLDAGSIIVETRHTLAGDTQVRERGDSPGLYSGTERVPGELVRVEGGDVGREAIVHRTLRAIAVDSATFHESSGERSLSSFISHTLGPVIGGALGLLF